MADVDSVVDLQRNGRGGEFRYSISTMTMLVVLGIGRVDDALAVSCVVGVILF